MSRRVSDLAAQAGLTAATVRYYEQLGLLPAPARTAAGYRIYGDEALDRLRFIKGAQQVGLRLREIGELLTVRDRGLCPCGHTAELLRQRMAEVDQEVARLGEVRAELAHMLAEYRTNRTRTRPRVAGGASKSSPETGGDSVGGMS